MVVVGADVEERTHAFVVVDEVGRKVGENTERRPTPHRRHSGPPRGPRTDLRSQQTRRRRLQRRDPALPQTPNSPEWSSTTSTQTTTPQQSLANRQLLNNEKLMSRAHTEARRLSGRVNFYQQIVMTQP